MARLKLLQTINKLKIKVLSAIRVQGTFSLTQNKNKIAKNKWKYTQNNSKWKVYKIYIMWYNIEVLKCNIYKEKLSMNNEITVKLKCRIEELKKILEK